jgi:hypothetical protein
VQPVYYHESLDATLWQVPDGRLGLSLPPLPVPSEAVSLSTGKVILRYALEFLQSPHALVVGYFETENGAVKTGRAAWDFIQAKWQLYPRADVVGVRSDGATYSGWLKDLDLGETPRILVYPDVETHLPLGTLAFLHAPAEASLPDLLAKYRTDLPTYSPTP